MNRNNCVIIPFSWLGFDAVSILVITELKRKKEKNDAEDVNGNIERKKKTDLPLNFWGLLLLKKEKKEGKKHRITQKIKK